MRKKINVEALPEFDLAEHLKTDEDIATYLSVVLEDNDSSEIRHALGMVARARGVTEVTPTADMKNTIDLSDALFSAANAHAARHGITLRALIEQSLARTPREAKNAPAFKLKDASVRGKGQTPAARAQPWSAILAAANER